MVIYLLGFQFLPLNKSFYHALMVRQFKLKLIDHDLEPRNLYMKVIQVVAHFNSR